VGLIAVAGVAAGTGIVMIVYLDEAFERHMREGRIRGPADVDAAVIEGASARVRPLLMTVATTVFGLLPLLWESGVGADVSARTAAPVVGGLWSCMVLTLLVLPAAYTMWRRGQVRRAMPAAPLANTVAVEDSAQTPGPAESSTPDAREQEPPPVDAGATAASEGPPVTPSPTKPDSEVSS
jgi:Cu(I)/Ag(I) efflux system membrane protein CusA/SilA